MNLRRSALLAALAAAALAFAGLRAADMPPSPPLSTIAPVEDLEAQVKYYLDELDECVQSQADFKDATARIDAKAVTKLEKKTHALAVVALAIGLHDQPSQLKKAAPALIKAAQNLAKAADYAAAKSGVENLKAALSSNGDPSSLRWTKVAAMHPLMGEVPMVHTAMKRDMKEPKRFEKYSERLARGAAAIAVIAHGSMPNADETEKPGEVAKWYQVCIEMRDAAAAMNKATHEKSWDAANAAMATLQKSCDDCHRVFKPDVVVE